MQVVGDQAGSKHTGDSRNRGKGGQPGGRSQRRTVEGVEMLTFGNEQVPGHARVETRIAARAGIRGRRFVTALFDG